MKERSFDEMIAYFNRRVADMDISQDCKMELLGMVAALGYKHEKSAQQWIPCSERLPSEGENVLLCDIRFGNVAIGKLIRYNTSCCWEVDHWDCDFEDWQAWMPLPDAYKEELNGERMECN